VSSAIWSSKEGAWYKERVRKIAYEKGKTYIEIHVTGVHFKPFLIHQFEGYAVKNVKRSIIFCTGNSRQK
jgi:hypothetical protein